MADLVAFLDIKPAVINSYDQARRTVTVRIDGVTDGADQLTEAQLIYPMGDKSEDTEIEILIGDRVWVAYVGDARHPIVLGYRPKQTGNITDWRRWHHANIRLIADVLYQIEAGTNFEVVAGQTVKITAPAVEITGNVKITGNVEMLGGSLTHNGKSVGATHTHGGVSPGSSNTAAPN